MDHFKVSLTQLSHDQVINIADLPVIERPREKLMRYGPARLSITELIAIVLRTGTKQLGVMSLAEKIYESCEGNLQTLNPEKISRIPGIGSVKVCEIMACIEIGKRFLTKTNSIELVTAESVWHMLADIRSKKKEHFVALYVDSRNVYLHKELISVGTVNMSVVHPREAFEPALRTTATGVIFAHNHPSGNIEASDADVQITNRLIEAGKILGIPVIDHLIVSESEYVSFKKLGLCDFE